MSRKRGPEPRISEERMAEDVEKDLSQVLFKYGSEWPQFMVEDRKYLQVRILAEMAYGIRKIR
jgi:hypothetical protein